MEKNLKNLPTAPAQTVSSALAALAEADAPILSATPASIRFVWGIEANGQIPNKLYLVQMGISTPLPAGTLITCLGSKTGYRTLKEDPENKRKFYSYSEKPVVGESDCKPAIAMLLGVLFPKGHHLEGQWQIAEMRTGGTQVDYFGKFSLVKFAAQTGLLVKIEDHTPNLTASKADPTRRYLAPWKFTQVEVVKLNREQVDDLIMVVETAETMVKTWAANSIFLAEEAPLPKE